MTTAQFCQDYQAKKWNLVHLILRPTPLSVAQRMRIERICKPSCKPIACYTCAHPPTYAPIHYYLHTEAEVKKWGWRQ